MSDPISYIRAGSNQYQVSPGFRNATLQAISDNVITPSEQDALGYQASQNSALPDEQNFVDFVSRRSAGAGSAEFEPQEISFAANRLLTPASSESNQIEQELNGFGPSRPFTPEASDEIRGRIQALRENGEDPGRINELQALNMDKTRESTRHIASQVIQTHTDIIADGVVTDDEFGFWQEQTRNLSLVSGFYEQENTAFAEHGGLLDQNGNLSNPDITAIYDPETRQLFERATRLTDIFDRTAYPSEAAEQTPLTPSDNSEAATNTWDVTTDVRYESVSSATGPERSEFSVGIAGSVDFDNFTVAGALDVTQTETTEGASPLPMSLPDPFSVQPNSLVGPIDDPDGTRISGSLSVSTEDGQRFTVRADSRGGVGAQYERRFDVSGRQQPIIGSLDARYNPDRDDFRLSAEIRMPIG